MKQIVIKFQRQSPPNERGMTLVEIVVVTVLLALITTILYRAFSGILAGKEFIEGQHDTLRTAEFVMGRLSQELSGAAPVKLSDPKENSQSQSPLANFAFPGTAGGAARLFMIGEDKRSNDHDADTLRFVSGSAAQEFTDVLGNAGLVEVKYSLEKLDKKNLPDEKNQLLALVREERPGGQVSPEIATKRRVLFPIAENVASLNFRYYKQKQWRKDWANIPGALPDAVEVRLELVDPDGSRETFKTAIAIPSQPQ